MPRINYPQELNSAQLEAVQSTEGPHLVIAGAGSGKTRVLVYRVAYLVEKGVHPDEILLLTFTRKAAEEMLRRASLLVDERCQRVAGGTFHSFANFTLRKFAPLVGLPNNFTILDESDAQDAINLIRTQLGFAKGDKRFPRKKAILEVISKSINKSQELGDVLYEEYPQFKEWENEVKSIRDEYIKYKKEKGMLDYDDLLVYLKNLLTTHEDVRLKLSRKYRYIMVDEYQDTNKIQALIACLLSSAHRNIMVVGDDAQSIYSFRGADFKNIIEFPKIFKDTKIITLEENYRSVQPILDLTNEVISFAGEKFEKYLFTRKKGDRLPVFVDAQNEHAQSKYVVDRILELREEGIELADIAVLFRSGWHSNDLEVELASRNIPFAKYGGQKFVEAAHIKDVLSCLRIVYNFHDEVSWYRLLLLMRGIGPKNAEKVIREIFSQNEAPQALTRGFLERNTERPETHPRHEWRGFWPRMYKGLEIDEKVINKNADLKKLFELLDGGNIKELAPAEMISAFLKLYEPLLKEKYDDFHKRLNDLDSLERIASRYDSLERFLTDMALEPPERSIVEAGFKDRDDSRLVLSTIHSAKGLEWHTVFVIYVAEGHLPSYLSLESKEAIEEERRLFYVAATRAKDNLYLLKPHIDRSPRSYMGGGGSVFTQVSRFLEEGDILNKFMQIETTGATHPLDEIDLSDITGDETKSDQEVMRVIKEHFRHSEDF